MNAIAPNAPIGATRTMMRMMPKNIFAGLVDRIGDRLAGLAHERDGEAGQDRDQQHLQQVAARRARPEKLSGMIASRWATMPSSLALVT